MHMPSRASDTPMPLRPFATVLKVVSAILARHGYEPVTAKDGLAGIELIKKGGQFDLVLLDFVMPRMNGY